MGKTFANNKSGVNHYKEQDSHDRRREDALILDYWRIDIENRIFRDLLGIKSREST